MSIEDALYSKLAGAAGVAALVGTRIYPAPLPEGAALPALTYQVISSPRNVMFGGDDGWRDPRVQITAWASTQKGAEALAVAVEGAIVGWSGTSGSLTIQYAYVDDEAPIYSPSFMPAHHGRALDVFVQYEV